MTLEQKYYLFLIILSKKDLTKKQIFTEFEKLGYELTESHFRKFVKVGKEWDIVRVENKWSLLYNDYLRKCIKQYLEPNKHYILEVNIHHNVKYHKKNIINYYEQS